MKLFRLIVLLTLLITVSCGEDTKVGSEKLLDIKEKEQQQRIGEFVKSPEPEPGESPQALGAGQQSPAPKETVAAQTAKPPFEIGLLKEHPYYSPQANLQVQGGTVMRITNRDDKVRRFRTTDGAYDTGDLPPGRTIDVPASIKGNFNLEDPNVPFATGSLQVF